MDKLKEFFGKAGRGATAIIAVAILIFAFYLVDKVFKVDWKIFTVLLGGTLGWRYIDMKERVAKINIREKEKE